MTPTVLIHIDHNGEPAHHMNGDVRFVIVDERAPHDRAYRFTVQTPLAKIDAIIGDDIGSAADARYSAIAARVKTAIAGKPALSVVGP